MSSAPKITVHNLADLKNTSDDAITNYLNSLRFRQSHTLTDTRLALGYSAFALTAACFAWDYKFGFESTKLYTALAVAVYTLLNGALTLWIWLVEKDIIYQGTSPSGEKLTISTTTTKNVPVYNLTVTVSPKSGGSPTTQTISQPFANWFDPKGTFVAPPFQQMVATNVTTVGKLDPKRVSVQGQQASASYSSEILDALMTANSSASATGSAAGTEGAAKRSKRRKA